MDSTLPVNYSSFGSRPGGIPGPRPASLPLLVDGLCPGASGEPLSLAGPGGARPVVTLTPSGRRHHVADAEDDDGAHRRPQTAGTRQDDAVDDAHDVRLSYPAVSQRSGPLLGDFKRYPNCNAVFCFWLGGLGSDGGEEERH